jgi:biopolymer transport protein TolQ
MNLPVLNGSAASMAATLVQPTASTGATDAPTLDPVQLVLHASIPVKLVMLVLVLMSVACWIVIGAKSLHLQRAKADSLRFLKVFDQSRSLDVVAQGIGNFPGSPFARIFAVGYDELARFTGGRQQPLNEAQGTHVDSVTRRAAAKEVNHLESWMGMLGTIGSTAPFIGLFGTVYGIMDAFLSIGNQQNANLPVVAPKIAEALIATAIGLVAAIPAVMAYNFFARRVQELSDTLETFAADVAA